jgi:catechol 2,3-dioxygenase-like lactoylglutathione lyase family enzyme
MSAEPEGPVTIDADALLGMRAVEAGVNALAQRNQHHLAGMGPEEQQEAANTWRQLAVEVLSAARDALSPANGDAASEGAGRAVIVLEDQGGDEVAVHVTFAPQLEELPDGSIAGTPAQLAAMSLLEAISGEQDDDDHGHGHSHEPGHGHEH